MRGAAIQLYFWEKMLQMKLGDKIGIATPQGTRIFKLVQITNAGFSNNKKKNGVKK